MQRRLAQGACAATERRCVLDADASLWNAKRWNVMTAPPPSDPGNRVVRFRPRGSQQPVQQPPSPVEDLAKYERSATEGDDDYRHRMLMNGIAALAVIVLVVAGWWIADTMAQMRKDQDCVLSGRRGCTPVNVPVEPR